MLRLEHVTKHYKGFDLDCSMEVRPGCVTGLIGKNGAGKSTTFKAILGLISPEGGSIQIFKKPSGSLSLQDKEQIGTVLSDSGFSGYLTVKELIPVLCAMYPNFQKDDFLRKCEEFSIPLKKKMLEFSTGMKQKLQVLTAISHNARLLILDEPTAGLDVIARDRLLDLLREYMEPGDRSILISSHISADLEGFCDDLYMIDEGKIIFHEDTDVLLSDYALLKMTEEQYGALDKSYILRYKKETFGYSCLTNQKQFYMENHPEVTVEKGTIDELILMMICGKVYG
ncbi:ABC transporter ATP-binding protein [Lachnospiraceae bacterium]|nr:ABC transporter ATP-binding protein [uncultured Schaedlerella sp.]MCI9152679.1 ABC transporter ATP-binding protein [Ruminococcus sp.]NBI57155.1 ABC transporter ATP-binding protein [Lachnospiraceae bacterium]